MTKEHWLKRATPEERRKHALKSVRGRKKKRKLREQADPKYGRDPLPTNFGPELARQERRRIKRVKPTITDVVREMNSTIRSLQIGAVMGDVLLLTELGSLWRILDQLLPNHYRDLARDDEI